MDEENKKLFDEVSIEDGIETSNEIDATPEMITAPKNIQNDFEFGDLSDKQKYEIILEEGDGVELDDDGVIVNEGKIFTIESAELLKPVTRDIDGNLIPPKIFNENNPDKKGYTTKLKILYKDSNYISMIPNIKWYLGPVNPQTGKKTLNPWFNINIKKEQLKDQFTAEISKLYYKFCMKYGYEPGKLSRMQFIKELPGKKVKLIQWKTFYQGSYHYRIDIKEFL